MTDVVTLPDPDLLDDLGPLPESVRAVLWDVASDPDTLGADTGEVVMVVLPYLGVPAAIGELGRFPRLRHLQTLTAGFDGLAEHLRPGMTLSNAGGVHDASTAEIAVALALASQRRIAQAVRDARTGTWGFRFHASLADRRILVVGTGGVGGAICRRLEPFEVQITRVARTARTDGLSDRFGPVHGIDELTTLLPQHDVVIAAVPLDDSTRDLFGAAELAAMADGALLVNVGRGAVVNTDALTAEVLSGRLRAACDVIDPEPLPPGHPLWQADNLILTPHLGGNTSAYQPRAVRMLRHQIGLIAAGREVDYVKVRG